MSIYDYHRMTLNPEIWQNDGIRLRRRAEAQINEQLNTRFSEASRAFLLGENVTHYYDEGSPIDILLLVPKQKVESARREAEYISGYSLRDTDHDVFFYILADTIKPEALAEKFGPMYDLQSGLWIGRRVPGLTELARPEALLQYIKWRLYKAKTVEDPYPYEWRILREAVAKLSRSERQELETSLRKTRAYLRYNLGEVLDRYHDARTWKTAEKLGDMFEADEFEDTIQEFLEQSKLPEPVRVAILNFYRYDDVLDQVEEQNERMALDEHERELDQGIEIQSVV
jgi:hypothetical protein